MRPHLCLRTRYYDQSVGRFTQQDTYLGNSSEPASLHKYLYANADPVIYTDPTGRFSSLSSLSVGIGISGILVASAVPNHMDVVIGNNWGSDQLTPTQTGWLIIAAVSTANSYIIEKIKDKINDDSDRKYKLFHGTDITSANLLLRGEPIGIDQTRCWVASCGGFYLADNELDADHFAVVTQGGFRNGGVVQYNFTEFAYLIIREIATIQPLELAPRFQPSGNEFIIPPSGFSIFNALMLKEEIIPSNTSY